MLFSCKIAPSCSYCRHGSHIGNGEIACVKRGITSVGGYCGRFTYDPLKREPERPCGQEKIVLPDALKEEDFII